MKFKKKTAMALSFTLGILMFATTAMAEVTTKSGYDQLKDSLKYTGKATTTGLSSDTLNMSFIIKDGNTTVYSRNSTNKYDITNKAMENVSETYNGSDKTDSYYYTDKNTLITKDTGNGISDQYAVTNFKDGKNDNKWLTNPFDEDRTTDIEKIADAIVGNLKDSVVVNEKSDGSKELSSSLNNTQIPSIANALVSFQFKNLYANPNDTRSKMPKLTKDIFVKSVRGNMTTNKNGLIKTALASGVLSGKDKNGQSHDLTFELLFKISDINSTKVNKPDLTGKKTTVTNASSNPDKITNPEKYIGKYTNDLTEEKDGKFIKIGEATVNIEKMNSKTVSGTYEVKYINGYENRNENYIFTGSFSNGKDAPTSSAKLTLTNKDKNTTTGDIYINPYQSGINFYLEKNDPRFFNSSFNRFFN
ncbi:hypothetical protein [Clostridium arbusti]|uniref:hypothetical protein n=1 Tax=Clostridium arbusti TaxID=1137848 RepID=UPI000287D505|nr:hypothetical protein [Clostridium arbusti]